MAANDDPKCPLCFVYLTPEGVCPNRHCPIKKVEYCSVCGCHFLEWECVNKRCLSKHPNVTERYSSLPPTVALPYETFVRSGSGERSVVRGYAEMLKSIHPNHPLLNAEDDDVTPCHFRSSLRPPSLSIQGSSFQEEEPPTREDRIGSGMFCRTDDEEKVPSSPKCLRLRTVK